MKNMIYIVTLVFGLSGCVASNIDMKTESNNSKSIASTLESARVEIFMHLKNNGINPKEYQMIFKSMGQSEGNSNIEWCRMFRNQEGYDYVNQNITISSNLITAMILDKSGNYVANSSPHTLITNPEDLNAYPLELRMIELGQKEDYLTYIELMNCKENYIIGFKENEVDVYQYTDTDLTLIYTKKN